MMQSCRIHVTGASGAGVTTLGRAIAQELAFAHHDTDDYYWLPPVPPFRQKRPIADRIRLMREMFAGRVDWVLTGSMDSWGEEIHDLFDWVVFVTASTSVRCERLKNREARHFGTEAVAEGGWRHRETNEFVEWAAGYDTGKFPGRSLLRHENWLKTLNCPVLRVDGAQDQNAVVQTVLNSIRV